MSIAHRFNGARQCESRPTSEFGLSEAERTFLSLSLRLNSLRLNGRQEERNSFCLISPLLSLETHSTSKANQKRLACCKKTLQSCAFQWTSVFRYFSPISGNPMGSAIWAALSWAPLRSELPATSHSLFPRTQFLLLCLEHKHIFQVESQTTRAREKNFSCWHFWGCIREFITFIQHHNHHHHPSNLPFDSKHLGQIREICQ